MRLSYVGAVAFAWLVLTGVPSLAAPPPIEAFGEKPQFGAAGLSPDGRYLGMVRNVSGRDVAVFLDLSKPDSKPLVTAMQGGIAHNIIWKSDDTAIVVFHATVKPRFVSKYHMWARAISVNMTTKAQAVLLFNTKYFGANLNDADIVDMNDGDAKTVLMTQYNLWDYYYMLDLYSVDVASGSADMVRHGNEKTIEFLTDGHGRLLGSVEQDSDLKDHVILGGKDVLDYSVRGGATFNIDGLTPDADRHFVVRKTGPSGTKGLYQWDGYGEIGAPIFQDPNYDVDDTLLDEHTGRVIGYTYVDDRPRIKFLDPARQHVQTLLEGAYPGQTVRIVSSDRTRTTFVFSTEGPRNPPVLSLFTASNHQANIVTEAYPTLKSADLGEMKPYPYKSTDGTDIHAYLTLPPGKDPHNLPAVIFPHGGPEARDAIGFDWWAQFMASRGYAVLQPNFRGSSGYGNFVDAGDGEWAGKVQDDVTSGVRKLIADGIVDPKRICIVGASYGGYMALAGATFSPDLYACAVSVAGVSDVDALLYRGTLYESEGSTYMKKKTGGDLAKLSPANFADRVHIPVLLIHGDKDTIVPIRQSEIEANALKRAGKDVQFVTLQGDDHFMEFAPTRTQMLRELERFLASNIGH
jgi:dipeptidyl aminopeptidase/acylaminoacyl peptidase